MPPELVFNSGHLRGSSKYPGLEDLGIVFPEGKNVIDADSLVQQAFARNIAAGVIDILHQQFIGDADNFSGLDVFLQLALDDANQIIDKISLGKAEESFGIARGALDHSTIQLRGIVRCIVLFKLGFVKDPDQYTQKAKESVQSILEKAEEMAKYLMDNKDSIIESTNQIVEGLEAGRSRFSGQP